MAIKDANLLGYLESLLAEGVDPVSREEEIRKRFGSTVAVLALDSLGFSRVSETHGVVHFLSRLVKVRHALKRVVDAHHVREVKFEADNVIAAFDNVDDAVAAALACHVAIADYVFSSCRPLDLQTEEMAGKN